MTNTTKSNNIKTSLAPWLSVKNPEAAVAFYKAAFGVKETYRLEVPGGGLVVKLSHEAAEFWVSNEAEEQSEGTQNVGGNSVRMILTVADPDAVFAQAVAAGATEIFPVGEDYGWRLGRVEDPFGLHWEIGHQLAE